MVLLVFVCWRDPALRVASIPFHFGSIVSRLFCALNHRNGKAPSFERGHHDGTGVHNSPTRVLEN